MRATWFIQLGCVFPRRHGKLTNSASSQRTSRRGHFAPTPWGHRMCCCTETSYPLDCGTAPTSGEPAFFGLDEWVDLLRMPGVQSFSNCHQLRPHTDRQPNRMAGNFDPLPQQHDLEALTPSEFCKCSSKAPSGWPRASVASVTEPMWCWCVAKCVDSNKFVVFPFECQ